VALAGLVARGGRLIRILAAAAVIAAFLVAVPAAVTRWNAWNHPPFAPLQATVAAIAYHARHGH